MHLLDAVMDDIEFLLNVHNKYGNRKYRICYIGYDITCQFSNRVSIARRLFPNCTVEINDGFGWDNIVSLSYLPNVVIIPQLNGVDNIISIINPLEYMCCKQEKYDIDHINKIAALYTKWYKDRVDDLIVSKFVKLLVILCRSNLLMVQEK
jgi:hypothetical protein